MKDIAWKLLLDVVLLFWSAFLLTKAKSASGKAIAFVAFLLVLALFIWRLSKL